MREPDPHLSEQDLLLAADGELPIPRGRGSPRSPGRLLDLPGAYAGNRQHDLRFHTRAGIFGAAAPARGRPASTTEASPGAASLSRQPRRCGNKPLRFCDGRAAAAVALSVALALLGILVLRSVQQPGTAQI